MNNPITRNAEAITDGPRMNGGDPLEAARAVDADEAEREQAA